MNAHHALVPQSANQALIDTLQSLLEIAQQDVLKERDAVDLDLEGPVQAEITQRMLSLSEKCRQIQRSAQGYVVAYVAREQLWRFHPNNYRSLRQYLTDAGLSRTAVCNLVALGDEIVPYCDHQEIKVDHVLEPTQWNKFRDAIPAMRRAIRDDEPETVESIITDVQKATDREAIRQKYQERRQRYGHGTTVQLGDGRVLFVAIADDSAAAATIVHRLGGALEWDLVLGTNVVNDTLKVVVDGRPA